MVPLIRHAFRQQVARRRRAVGGTTCPFRWAVRHLAAGQHERWPAPGASDSAGVGVCAEDALVNPSSCEAYSHRPARGTPGACTDRPHRHRRVQEGGRPGAIGCGRYAGGLGLRSGGGSDFGRRSGPGQRLRVGHMHLQCPTGARLPAPAAGGHGAFGPAALPGGRWHCQDTMDHGLRPCLGLFGIERVGRGGGLDEHVSSPRTVTIC